MTNDLGDLTTTTESATVRFERVYDAPIERVWEALATADGLGSWLTDATVVEGERIDLDFGEHGNGGGAVRTWQPPTLLEYDWEFPGEPDSVVCFELEEVSGKTRLVLTHRLLPLEQAPGYGAGWHAHLDQLEAALAGEKAKPWSDRFDELLPEYSAL